MKVRFTSPKKQNPDEDGGLPVRYGPAKRAVPKWRWYILVLVISTPLLFLLWRVGAAMFFINAPGVISLEKVSINSPFPAVVERISVSPGARTAHGDLLMRLERCDEARAEFERAAQLTRNSRERALLMKRVNGARRS